MMIQTTPTSSPRPRGRPRKHPRPPSGRTAELTLFPKQLDAVTDSRRFVALVGGLASGKTHAGAVKLISRANRQELGLVCAPTFPMLRDATQRTLFGLFKDLGIRYEHNKSENLTTLESGHEIMFRSLDDPDNMRGPNVAYAWIDEGSYIIRRAWDIVKGRVRVGDMQQLWVTTTPKGRNWIYDEFVKSKTHRHGLYRMSSYENTTLDPDYIPSLGYTGRFAEQEIGGEFVAFDGLVYQSFNRETMVRQTGTGVDADGVPRVDVTGWRTIQGGDVGARNPTAILTIHLAGDGRVHVSREFYERGMGAKAITNAFIDEAGIANPESVFIDPSAAAYIDDLLGEGLPIERADNDVQTGIQKVTTAIEEGFTVDPSCVHLISEMETYHYPEEKENRVTNSDKPVKQNDHCADALRYGLMGAGDPPMDLEEFYRWQN